MPDAGRMLEACLGITIFFEVVAKGTTGSRDIGRRQCES